MPVYVVRILVLVPVELSVDFFDQHRFIIRYPWLERQQTRACFRFVFEREKGHTYTEWIDSELFFLLPFGGRVVLRVECVLPSSCLVEHASGLQLRVVERKREREFRLKDRQGNQKGEVLAEKARARGATCGVHGRARFFTILG